MTTVPPGYFGTRRWGGAKPACHCRGTGSEGVDLSPSRSVGGGGVAVTLQCRGIKLGGQVTLYPGEVSARGMAGMEREGWTRMNGRHSAWVKSWYMRAGN